ncbi:hypothetical protein [Kitasatospora sp. NPDC048407]|uniref:hypothetical protein n=1 Tax=Kitasatospora sp. NPDC048407 TaxID=3364051 RepID=UPI0037156B2A
MRALKRVLAVSALAAPLVVGCAGLASAQEDLSANFDQGQFAANQSGAGEAATTSVVSPYGVQHTDFMIWADDSGVSGGFNGAGASY